MKVNNELEDQYSDVLKKFRYGRKMGLRSLSEMTGISTDRLREAEAGSYIPSGPEWDLLGRSLGFDGSVMQKIHFSPDMTPRISLPEHIVPVGESYFGYPVWAYLALDPHNPRRALLIDTGGIGEILLSTIEKMDLTLEGILLTHGHSDHAGNLARLGPHLPEEVVLSEPDVKLLDGPVPSRVRRMEPESVSRKYAGDGWHHIEVFRANGHTSGSVAYLIGGVLFVGDAIFCGSCGRAQTPEDFPESLSSVKRLLEGCPDETIIVSGHGPFTTVRKERDWNPFYRARPESAEEPRSH